MDSPSTAAPALWHRTSSAAEDRELRAIARDAIGEALVAGRATCTFRGHCLRVDCWSSLSGMVALCIVDGQVVDLAVSMPMWINDLRATGQSTRAPISQFQPDLQFGLESVPRANF